MKKNKLEGSKKDMREDRAMAKKAGMSMDKWERSAADKKHDTKKMARGGRASMDDIRSKMMSRRGERKDMPSRGGAMMKDMPSRGGYGEPMSTREKPMPSRPMGREEMMPSAPVGRGTPMQSAPIKAMPSPAPAAPAAASPLGGLKSYGGGDGMDNMQVMPRPAAPAMDKSQMMRQVMPPQTAMKKGGVVKKMAKGGMVRGAGCAVRGVKKAKNY